MKVLRLHSIRLATAVAGLALGAWATATAGWSQGVSVTISTPNATVHTGEPIPIHFVMTNATDHSISVTRPPTDSSAEFHYRFQVREKSGRPVPETEHHRSIARGWAGSELQLELKPGEKLEEDSELTKQFDLSAVGTYDLQVFRSVQGEGKDPAQSNKLTIVVTP
jgi:hypothetical protein